MPLSILYYLGTGVVLTAIYRFARRKQAQEPVLSWMTVRQILFCPILLVLLAFGDGD